MDEVTWTNNANRGHTGSDQGQGHLVETVHDKRPYKYDPDKHHDGRKIHTAKIDGDPTAYLIKNRFSNILNKPDNRVEWIRVYPGENGAGNDNPHKGHQRDVQHFGHCHYEIPDNVHPTVTPDPLIPAVVLYSDITANALN